MESPHACCHYTNLSEQIVILRCIGPDRFFHEKVIFPFEDWLFSCPASSDVQIWSHGVHGVDLLESFMANELLIDEVQVGTDLLPGQASSEDALPLSQVH
jgi:hypothetical protein